MTISDSAQAGCWKMYKATFLGILEAEKSQKKHSVHKKIMDSMTSRLDSKIFYVNFGFWYVSASKLPRKTVFHIF